MKYEKEKQELLDKLKFVADGLQKHQVINFLFLDFIRETSKMLKDFEVESKDKDFYDKMNKNMIVYLTKIKSL